MTRRRALDWVLIVALTAVWAVLFARGIQDGLRTQRGAVRLGVASAVSADVYPMVLWSWYRPALVRGDQLLSVDGEDVRGDSALQVYDRLTRTVREHGHVGVVADRDGVRFDHVLGMIPLPFWWTAPISSLAGMAMGLVLLICAPAWHLSRRVFLAAWCFAAGRSLVEGAAGPAITAFEAGTFYALLAAGSVLAAWSAQDFSLSVAPVPAWHRGLALAAGGLLVTSYLVLYHLPIASNILRDAIGMAANLGGSLVAVLALTRAYLGSSSLDRRRLRWVVLGFCLAMVGSLLGALVATSRLFAGLLGEHGPSTGRVIVSVFGLAVPIGVVSSVVGYRRLDVDRLISATASYSIVGFAALGIALALAPRIANATGPALGLDPAVAQWLLLMALVLGAVPAHVFLWPRLDARMFVARHRRRERFERLLGEIARCSNRDELWELTSERLDEVLEPQSIVVYARDGEGFVPRFARGREAFTRYDADSLLVRALARHARPLAADSRELDPFDRAALEALGVALILPIRVSERVMAFACLGSKRSGDIYTREEQSGLAAVASRCAELLAGADEAQPQPAQVFRREGDLWTIASRGKQIHLRDMRGLRYLAMLVGERGREFAALDLARAASGLASERGAIADPDLVVVRRFGDAGPVPDSQARSEYRKRVAALETELADAERCADLGRLERASAEREVLLAELESSGRGRHSGSDSERARVAVTKAIKVALERISESHPELGVHLTATIRRGYVCAYEPDPRDPADWEV